VASAICSAGKDHAVALRIIRNGESVFVGVQARSGFRRLIAGTPQHASWGRLFKERRSGGGPDRAGNATMR
jgi:hypothetical protein